MPTGGSTTLHAPLLLAVALLAPPGAGDQAGASALQAADSTFSESVSVEQVLVPVVVRSGSRFVEGLGRDDFELFVDGHRTTISSFEHSSAAPVHTLVLLDLSGSMGGRPKLAWSREVLGHLLNRAKPGDRYTLATFAASGVVVEPRPVSERTAVEAWAARWRPYGRTGIHDAVARVPDLISADSAWRGAVLLITDGIDNASEIPARDARLIARRAEVPVHVIALIGGRAVADEADWSSDPLRLLSWVTGGRFHSIVYPANVKTASEDFISGLRSQYILGFPTSGIGQARPRDIRVEVRGKKRKVSFRREYIGTLPGRVGAVR